MSNDGHQGEITREQWIRYAEEKIRRLFPWWLRPFMRWLAGYSRRDIP